MALTSKEFIKFDCLVFQYVVLGKKSRKNMLKIKKLEEKATKVQIDKINHGLKQFSQFYE